jgi:hypothetical protein
MTIGIFKEWLVQYFFVHMMQNISSACGFSTKKKHQKQTQFESGHFQTFCYFI